MPLNILAPEEYPPVEQLVVVIHGKPSQGKTTLANSSTKPIVLDFESGSRRVDNRGECVVVTNWTQVDNIVAADLAPYDTVVVDTVGAMAKVLSHHIIATVPKTGRSGKLWQQGYGELKARLDGWVSHIRSLGKHLVFVAHTTEQERDEHTTVERIILPGSFKEDLYGMADLMGRLSLVAGERWLAFDPTDVSYGKNPGKLPVQRVPDVTELGGYLGGLIDETMERMNDDGEEANAKREEKRLAAAKAKERAWADYLDGITAAATPQALSAAAITHRGRSDLTDEQVRAGDDAIGEAARARGWVFDKQLRRFVEQAPAEEAQPQFEEGQAEEALL